MSKKEKKLEEDLSAEEELEIEAHDQPADQIEQPPQELDATDRLQQALDGLRPGHYVIVRRVRPTWCKGWLEQVEVIDGEPLDMDYFVRQWGGEVLRLQIRNERGRYMTQADVPLYSYPPRFKGRLLEPPKEEPIPYPGVQTPYDRSADRPIGQQQQTANPLDSIGSLANLLQSLTDGQQKQILGYFDLLQRTAQPATVTPPMGADQLLGLVKVYEQLRSVFGGPVGPAGPPIDEEGNFMGYLTDIIKTVMTPQPRQAQQRSQAPDRGRIVQPQPAHKQPPLSPVDNGPDLKRIASMLSQLPDDKALDVVTGALGMMSPEKQQRIIPAFLERSGIGDLFENDDENEEDENIDETTDTDNNKQ